MGGATHCLEKSKCEKYVNIINVTGAVEHGYCILVDMLIWKNTLEAHVQLEFITNHDQMGKDGFEGNS